MAVNFFKYRSEWFTGNVTRSVDLSSVQALTTRMKGFTDWKDSYSVNLEKDVKDYNLQSKSDNDKIDVDIKSAETSEKRIISEFIAQGKNYLLNLKNTVDYKKLLQSHRKEKDGNNERLNDEIRYALLNNEHNFYDLENKLIDFETEKIQKTIEFEELIKEYRLVTDKYVSEFLDKTIEKYKNKENVIIEDLENQLNDNIKKRNIRRVEKRKKNEERKRDKNSTKFERQKEIYTADRDRNITVYEKQLEVWGVEIGDIIKKLKIEMEDRRKNNDAVYENYTARTESIQNFYNSSFGVLETENLTSINSLEKEIEKSSSKRGGLGSWLTTNQNAQETSEVDDANTPDEKEPETEKEPVNNKDVLIGKVNDERIPLNVIKVGRNFMSKDSDRLIKTKAAEDNGTVVRDENGNLVLSEEALKNPKIQKAVDEWLNKSS